MLGKTPAFLRSDIKFAADFELARPPEPQKFDICRSLEQLESDRERIPASLFEVK
jgi:hypothetical protein